MFRGSIYNLFNDDIKKALLITIMSANKEVKMKIYTVLLSAAILNCYSMTLPVEGNFDRFLGEATGYLSGSCF
jgi:hypothetical protein